MNNKKTDPDFECIAQVWPYLTWWQRKKIMLQSHWITFLCRLTIRWAMWQAGLRRKA